MKNAYGISALMEAIASANREDEIIDEINDAVDESASFLDIGHQFVSSDQVEQDMDVEQDIDDEEGAELDRIIDMIDDDEDEIGDEALESVEALIESMI